jgi:hypothetical protein
VGRHQLLLLTHGTEEAQRVRAEADQPEHREQRQAQPGPGRHAQALTRGGGSQYQERQCQAGGDLDPDPRDQRCCAGTEARVGARGEQQRGGERQQLEHVVVSAADGQHEQHGVQAHEGGRPARRMPTPARGARDQCHRAEARGGHDRFERPQPAGEPEWRDRVAEEREQRAVGRVLVGPTQKSIDGVGGRLCGDVRVGVQSVQGAQTGEAEVAEHVL